MKKIGQKQMLNLWLSILCIVLYITPVEASEPGKSVSRKSEKRVLQFPKTFSMGQIELVSTANQGTRTVADAKGKVEIVIPPEYYVQLDAGNSIADDPKRLEQAPALGIDSLKLRFVNMDDAARSICDRVLKYAPHFKNLTHLVLRQSDITDDGLQVVTQLPMLQEIDLFATDIHGQCLTNFHRLHDLENLNLSFNGLESPYLHFLTELPALRALNLRKTGINRDGIRQIARCKNLESLTLSANRHVDDECVFGLALLTKLQSLDLDGTTVTKVGLMKLASLDLRNLSLPVAIQSKSDLAELHRAFPHCYLNVSKATRVTTKDEKVFFAPLK